MKFGLLYYERLTPFTKHNVLVKYLFFNHYLKEYSQDRNQKVL